MATIQKRINAEGEISHHVRVRLRGHPTQTCTFSRLTDAREWAQQTETAIREGRYFKTAEAKKHTVGEMIDRYLKTIQQRKPKRYAGVHSYLLWWKEQIGAYMLSDVTRALIIEKRDILIQGTVINKKLKKSKREPKLRTPATANRYMVALCTAFTMAVNEWEWLQDQTSEMNAWVPDKIVERRIGGGLYDMPEPDYRLAVIERSELKRWANARGLKPKFLFPEMRDEKRIRQEEKTVIKEQEIDKACVQAVVRTLRDIDPNITSEALSKHKAVRVHANGGQWKPSTLKTWIREIDERPKEERPGRPRKTATENIKPAYEDVEK